MSTSNSDTCPHILTDKLSTNRVSTFSYCGIFLLYESLGATDRKTEFYCGPVSGVSFTFYRTEPVHAPSATNTAFNLFSSSVAFSFSSIAPLPVPTYNYTPLPSLSFNNGNSKAWIAGAVVGPLIGLPLAGAFILGILLLTRKMQNTNRQSANQAPHSGGGGAAMATVHPTYPPGETGYQEAKPTMYSPPISPVNQAYGPGYNHPPPQHGLAVASSPGPAPYAEPYPTSHDPANGPLPPELYTPQTGNYGHPGPFTHGASELR